MPYFGSDCSAMTLGPEFYLAELAKRIRSLGSSGVESRPVRSLLARALEDAPCLLVPSTLCRLYGTKASKKIIEEVRHASTTSAATGECAKCDRGLT